jgi:hypothetical protein
MSMKAPSQKHQRLDTQLRTQLAELKTQVHRFVAGTCKGPARGGGGVHICGQDSTALLAQIRQGFLQRFDLKTRMASDTVERFVIEAFASVADEPFDYVKAAIEGRPPRTWSIARPLFGAYMDKDEAGEFQLGALRFVAWNVFKNEIDTEGRNDERDERETIVAVSIDDLCDASTAAELGREIFERLDYLIQYTYRSVSLIQRPGVFSSRPSFTRQAWVSSESEWHEHSMFEGTFATPLSRDVLVEHGPGGDWAWQRLGKKHMCNFEQRIFASLDWLGKSFAEPDPARSILESVLALESLIQQKDTGVLILPGIVHQLSEAAAFILGNDVDSRRSIRDAVKEIYKVRSAIVHSGSTKVTHGEAQRARNLMVRLIEALTTAPHFGGMESIKAVLEWVEQQKFSSPASVERQADD